MGCNGACCQNERVRPATFALVPCGARGLTRIAAFHNLGSGGAKRALHGLLRYLTDSGHSVEVFVPSTANEVFLPLHAVTHGVRVFPVRTTLGGIISSSIKYVPPVADGCSLVDLDRLHKTIAQTINDRDYAAVIVEQDRYTMSPFILRHLTKPSVYFCQQPSRRGEPILRILEGALHEHALNGRGRRDRFHSRGTSVFRWARQQMGRYAASVIAQIDRDNASAASTILANSLYSKESILRAYGLNACVSYLGVDTTVFKRLPKEKEQYLLSVGSCTPEKGFDFLIRVLGRLEGRLRPKLIIVSNTVITWWRQWLEQLAAREDVTLEFQTLLPDAELVELYNRALGFLYAPYLEPFGLAPVEAMACGTAVVAVKEGGVKESVIDNETGTLVERDEDSFAEAVRELLLDKAKRDRVGNGGVEWVRGFWTQQHAGQRLLKNLDRAVNAKRLDFNRASGNPRGS